MGRVTKTRGWEPTRRNADDACDTLWGITRDYLERHGEGEAGALALELLAASLDMADGGQKSRFCEDNLVRAVGFEGLAETERRLRQDGRPISQEDIIRELISLYQDDPEIVARLEAFLASFPGA